MDETKIHILAQCDSMNNYSLKGTYILSDYHRAALHSTIPFRKDVSKYLLLTLKSTYLTMDCTSQGARKY